MAVIAATYRVRKDGGASSTPSLTILQAQTGQFESTNSDTLVLTNQVNYSVVTAGTAGVIGATHIGCLILNNTTNIKTFDGIPYADVTSWRGYSLATVLKSWDGIT